MEKELTLEYKSFLGDLDVKKDFSQLELILQEKMEKIKYREIKVGYTLIGPQKDEFLFLLNNKDSKSYSSQGEKKSIIFALKTAEIDMVIRETKEKPVFLIDDISSYFDSIRKDSILKYFKTRDIQLFISSTSKLDLDIDTKEFLVDRGGVIEKYNKS